MKRFEVIQKYIDKYNYKTYLEIGVQKGKNFNKIKAEVKASVDPETKYNPNFPMTSDDFFWIVDDSYTFDEQKPTWDIIFCDGLHESPQLYRDIINSLRYLSEGGTIICHDCNPINENSQKVPRIQKHWNGDVWKDIVRLRKERDDIKIFTIDTDEGCCVIRKSSKVRQILDITNCDINYENLEKNRKEWLNLVNVDEWLKKLEDGK